MSSGSRRSLPTYSTLVDLTGKAGLFLRNSWKGWEEQVFRPNLSTGRISVTLEKAIPSGRIDVYIQLGNGDAAHCLAIENKPYAQDQQNQIKDYLKFLKGTFGERFVLIYLSPKGEGPSNSSIPKEELGKWKRRFAILPYYTVDNERHHDVQKHQPDGFEDYRLPYSLADWFKKCRRNCEVDRLRWFLRDAEVFCERNFGGRTMTTDSETKAVEEFLRSSNPKNLAIARAVHEAWPAIRNGICETFLRKLCSRVESEVKERIPRANDHACWVAGTWANKNGAIVFGCTEGVGTGTRSGNREQMDELQSTLKLKETVRLAGSMEYGHRCPGMTWWTATGYADQISKLQSEKLLVMAAILHGGLGISRWMSDSEIGMISS